MKRLPLLLALLVAVGSEAQYTPGGLVSLASSVAGTEKLSNAGFETGSVPAATGWTYRQSVTGWQASTAQFNSGSKSLMFSGGWSAPTPTAYQALTLTAGTYQISGYWKSSGFGDANNYVRVCLTSSYDAGDNCAVIHGTAASWTAFSATSLSIPSDGTYYLALEDYNNPVGTIYFDDLSVKQSLFPVSVFMTYPNYRGMLFSSQSPVMTFDTTVTPPDGTLAHYNTKWTVTDETTSGVLTTGSHAAVAHETVSLDATGWTTAHNYLVSFQLLLASDSSVVYTYPSYRVVPAAGSVLTSAHLAYNASNQFLMAGTPTFILGVYDSGLDYSTTAGFYTNQWNVLRRLNQLPINFYHNYWYGAMDNTSTLPELDAAATAGFVNMQGANCVVDNPISGFWVQTASDADVQARAAKAAFGGWYTADECVPTMVPGVFSYYAREKALAPGTVNWITQTDPTSMALWRDTADVLSMDPYVTTSPTTNISQVATWTAASKNAVLSSRPVLTVVQFMGNTLGFSWPTAAQLRNMSYMAVAEGANGLVYWEVGQGQGGLYGQCDGSSQAQAHNLLNAKVGVADTDQLGLPGYYTLPHTWVINSGSVPGLSITAGGAISGTPTTPGTYYLNVTVDSTVTATMELVVLSDWTADYPSGSVSWCDYRVSKFGELVTLTTELHAIQAALASTDDNGKLTGNTQAGIHTRVKTGTAGYHYIIASNNTGSTLTPTFTWATGLPTVQVYGESRGIMPIAATFSDTFTAYQSHVYQIADAGSGGTQTIVKGAVVIKGAVTVK